VTASKIFDGKQSVLALAQEERAGERVRSRNPVCCGRLHVGLRYSYVGLRLIIGGSFCFGLSILAMLCRHGD
jgi:hypothetical protein